MIFSIARAVNRRVVGSSPTWGAMKKTSLPKGIRGFFSMKPPLAGLMKERRRFADEEIKNGRGGRLRFISERSKHLH